MDDPSALAGLRRADRAGGGIGAQGQADAGGGGSQNFPPVRDAVDLSMVAARLSALQLLARGAPGRGEGAKVKVAGCLTLARSGAIDYYASEDGNSEMVLIRAAGQMQPPEIAASAMEAEGGASHDHGISGRRRSNTLAEDVGLAVSTTASAAAEPPAMQYPQPTGC